MALKAIVRKPPTRQAVGRISKTATKPNKLQEHRHEAHKLASNKAGSRDTTSRMVKVGNDTRRRNSPIMAHVTATRAKNEFGAILEQAIHGGAVAITRHAVPKAVLMPYAEYELLEKARSSMLEDLASQFDGLLASMQTSKSKRAVEAAFEASPARLGRAAVKQAGKKW